MFHYQVSFIVYINVDQCSVADYLSSHGTRKIRTIYQQTLCYRRRKEGIDYKKKVYLVHSPQGTSLPDPYVLLKVYVRNNHSSQVRYTQNPRLLTPLTCYCMFRRLVKNDTKLESILDKAERCTDRKSPSNFLKDSNTILLPDVLVQMQ